MSQFSVELLCSFSLIVDVLLSERSSSSFVLQSRIHYLLRLKKVYLFQEELVSEVHFKTENVLENGRPLFSTAHDKYTKRFYSKYT